MEIMTWEKEFLVDKIFFKLISIERRKQTCLRFEVRYVRKVHTQVYFLGKEASGVNSS